MIELVMSVLATAGVEGVHHIYEEEHWEEVFPWAHLFVVGVIAAAVYAIHRVHLWWFVRSEERKGRKWRCWSGGGERSE